MRPINLNSCLAAAVFAVSCATANADPLSCEIGGDSGSGLVVFSGTMPIREPHVGLPLSFVYEYNQADASTFTNRKVGLSRGIVFGKRDSDFSDPASFGQIFALRLPAGHYEFRTWSYKPFGVQGNLQPNGIHPLTFDVESGHAIYVGAFEPALVEERGLLHPSYKAWLTVQDRHDRDLAAFLRKCSGFDSTQMKVKIMDASPWNPPPVKRRT